MGVGVTEIQSVIRNASGGEIGACPFWLQLPRDAPGNNCRLLLAAHLCYNRLTGNTAQQQTIAQTMERRLLKNADPMLLACVLAIVAYGALMVYSCTGVRTGESAPLGASKFRLHLLWIALGLVCLALAASVDYLKLARFKWHIYAVTLGLLVLVLARGYISHGAQRWIELGPVRFQPAELAQLTLIIVLGIALAERPELRRSLATLTLSLGIVALPTALIFFEPDLGTPVILVGIWLVMLVVYGMPFGRLAAVCALGLIVVVVGLGALWVSGHMPEHQQQRLMAFVYPDADPEGSGWHSMQSIIAIGSGGLVGKGLFEGTQSELGFVPEQETDFIMTVVGEEWGFVGSVVLLALYFILLYRVLDIAMAAKDECGRLIAAGIAAMIFLHVFINVGMTLRLLPAKGLPLPFFSYGGSSMITGMLAIGLLESICMRRHKITF